MGRLRLCCEGVDIISEAEPKQSITTTTTSTTTIPEKTQPFRKANDATVIPAKRKCVKNTVCSCFIHCICGKCLNTNTNATISPPTPTASNFNGRSRSSGLLSRTTPYLCCRYEDGIEIVIYPLDH